MSDELSDFLKDKNYVITSKILGEITLTPETRGQGGAGRVYAGMWRRRNVAIKFLRPDGKSNVERFKDEFFNVKLANLKHGAISLAMDYIAISDKLEIPFIVMKLYSKSLADLHTPVDNEVAEKYLNFLLNALEELEGKGIVHRDIKPENILIEDDDVPYLADFGIAWFNPNNYENEHCTGTGEHLNNRRFSAPEQDDPNCEPAITMDIYAMAQVFNYLVTGATKRGSSPIDLKELNAYNDVISHCLRDKPEDRLKTVSEIRGEIEKLNKEKIFKNQCDLAVNSVLEFHKTINYALPDHCNITKVEKTTEIKRLFVSLEDFKFENLHGIFLGEKDEYVGDLPLSSKHVKYLDDNYFLIMNQKYHIKDLWVVTDNCCAQRDNDFILIIHDPFEKQYGSRECFYKGKAISEASYEKGIVEIDDVTIVKIEEGEGQDWINCSANGLILLSTDYSCSTEMLSKDYTKLHELFDILAKDISTNSEEAICFAMQQMRRHHNSYVMVSA